MNSPWRCGLMNQHSVSTMTRARIRLDATIVITLVVVMAFIVRTETLPLEEQSLRPSSLHSVEDALRPKKMSMMRLKKKSDEAVEKRLSKMRLKKDYEQGVNDHDHDEMERFYQMYYMPKRMSMMRLKKQNSPSADPIKRMSMMRLRRGPSMLRLRRGPSMMRLKKMTQMRLKRRGEESPMEVIDCLSGHRQCNHEDELELEELLSYY